MHWNTCCDQQHNTQVPYILTIHACIDIGNLCFRFILMAYICTCGKCTPKYMHIRIQSTQLWETFCGIRGYQEPKTSLVSTVCVCCWGSIVSVAVESMENHGSLITHLLSQLRIGMDLTKVVLPTFILEKRSLLEMYSDFFAHPDLFVE